MARILQAGAVPFRIVDSRAQFLLVTSRKGHWIFPKGVVEEGETPEEAASKEVKEEAGIEGSILPGPVGSFHDWKDREPCQVLMFLFEYASDADSWRESGARAKKWCGFEDALRLLKKKEFRQILERARERVEGRGSGDAATPMGSTS